MHLPAIRGTIDRRLLLNYRVDADTLARLLPQPFCPQLVRGHAMAGICLIRLKHIRPACVPLPIGIASENAAHRFAVQWDDAQGHHTGVYIPRRDTDSRLNTLVGGRLFPGDHHHARFAVDERDRRYAVQYQSDDGSTHVEVDAEEADALPCDSIFGSVTQASKFFEAGELGYSATRISGRFHGLELQCDRWAVQPLHVRKVRSSYFEDTALFPTGSVHFDHALLMRGIEHEWRGRDPITCGDPPSAPPPASPTPPQSRSRLHAFIKPPCTPTPTPTRTPAPAS